MADYVSEIWVYTLLFRWFGCATLMCRDIGVRLGLCQRESARVCRRMLLCERVSLNKPDSLIDAQKMRQNKSCGVHQMERNIICVWTPH